MKKILLFLCLLCADLLAQTNSTNSVTPPPLPPITNLVHTVNVTLAWYYPNATNDPTLSFIVLQGTNLAQPITNWATITNIMETNCPTMTLTFPVVPGQYFWAIEASNWWGTYSFIAPASNIASTPPIPAQVVSNTITKGP